MTLAHKLEAYVRLGRVSNLPTVWTNVLAGAVLAGAEIGVATVVAPLAALSLLYVSGMVLNDAFDAPWDERERPERPIPSGLVTYREAMALGFALLGGGVLILAGQQMALGDHGDWAPLASGIVLAAAIILYDSWHKGNQLSPVLMGLCRALVYVTAGLAAARAVRVPVIAGAAVLLAYIVGLSFVAKYENLTRVRNLWPLLFLGAPLLYTAPLALRSAMGALFYVAFAAWVGSAVWRLRKEGRGVIPGVVSRLIAGVSLLDALLIACSAAPAYAFVALLGVPLTMSLQRRVPGT